MTKDKLRQDIIRAFGFKLQGNKKMKYFVADTLILLPQKIAEEVIDHCWFVSSFEDTWGFALRHEDLKKGDCLIFLSDELWNESADQIRHTITHEIGHFILGHRNSILIPQTKSEVRKQEHEADEFVKEFTEA